MIRTNVFAHRNEREYQLRTDGDTFVLYIKNPGRRSLHREADLTSDVLFSLCHGIVDILAKTGRPTSAVRSVRFTDGMECKVTVFIAGLPKGSVEPLQPADDPTQQRAFLIRPVGERCWLFLRRRGKPMKRLCDITDDILLDLCADVSHELDTDSELQNITREVKLANGVTCRIDTKLISPPKEQS